MYHGNIIISRKREKIDKRKELRSMNVIENEKEILTPEQIREIVSVTVDELIDKNMIDNRCSTAIKTTERHLYDYFKDKEKYKGIGAILRTLKDDEYINIIYLRYREHKTLEQIAEIYNKDVSTIKRNRRRLLKKIYTKIERG